MIHLLATGIALLLIVVVLWDTFETIVLPRSVTRKLRLARFFYQSLWTLWSKAGERLSYRGKDKALGIFGPMSLILLLGFWAVCLIAGFALLQWGLGIRLAGPDARPNFGTALYFSGTTFFTLGLGDIRPETPLARLATVVEAGIGFGFLAVVIGYLPVLYQAFSRREANITLLDARASSPPSALELLRRHGESKSMEALIPLLSDWEKWASELLESHLSYPVLAYYRSQHDGQSWLASLTTILDTCALVSLEFDGKPAWHNALRWQARLTFAMARHAIVDLALVFNTPPSELETNRLSTEDWQTLRKTLAQTGIPLCEVSRAEERLAALRQEYEPYVHTLSERFLLDLPPWVVKTEIVDNWQASAWEHSRHF